MTAPRKLLTVNQVADQISLSRWAVINLINAHATGDPAGLPAVNVGGAGTAVRYRIEPAALERWLEARRVAA